MPSNVKSKTKPTIRWPRWFERLSHKNLTRWQVVFGFVGLPLALLALLATIYFGVFSNPSAPIVVTQQQPGPASPGTVDPRANIEVVSYANGVARLKIRMVNEGTKPLRDTYMHWGIDSTIGTVTGFPATTHTSKIKVGGRELVNLVAFLEKPLYSKRSFLIWDLTITGMRPGAYPMRLQFVTEDGTFTHPKEGLDPVGMSLTVAASPKS